MSATLYLLRQNPDLISSSIFRADDTDMDIVFIEQASLKAPYSAKGTVVATTGIDFGFPHATMTYDDLIESIFSYEHIIVV